ncbi:hypothetical protein GCM10022377_14200 [Zhihengliuella alba]|uniref:Septum formation initiator family protein n=1 Tax=Zhihengliuella alba TaxID=547018 RepID=A0ABP7DAD2_9MICC
MTTRRPRMPRAGNGAPRPPRPTDREDAVETRSARSDDPQRRPSGDRQSGGQQSAGRKPAGGRVPDGRQAGNRSAADGPGARPGSTRPQQAQAKRSGTKPSQPRTDQAKPAPARSSRNDGAPAVLRLPKSEARLRQRAELSGAIRSGRPGSAEPGAGPDAAGTQEAAPVPARSFSGRLIALAVVLAAVTALLLPSVGVYMEQRKELTALQETIATLEAEQEHLETQVKRWEDPAYIRQQARERINLVMPGERKYMVVGEPPQAAGEPLSANASPSDVPADLPWVDALWDSVKRAATD